MNKASHSCSYDEIRTEQRELRPQGEGGQQAFAELPVRNQNLEIEPGHENRLSKRVWVQSASDLVNNVDQPIGRSDV